MNYIKKLESQNRWRQMKIEALEQGYMEIRRYLNSDKFNGPDIDAKMVNREDIFLRINEILADVNKDFDDEIEPI